MKIQDFNLLTKSTRYLRLLSFDSFILLKKGKYYTATCNILNISNFLIQCIKLVPSLGSICSLNSTPIVY